MPSIPPNRAPNGIREAIQVASSSVTAKSLNDFSPPSGGEDESVALACSKGNAGPLQPMAVPITKLPIVAAKHARA